MQRRYGTRAQLSPGQTALCVTQQGACCSHGMLLPPVGLALLLLLVALEPCRVQAAPTTAAESANKGKPSAEASSHDGCLVVPLMTSWLFRPNRRIQGQAGIAFGVARIGGCRLLDWWGVVQLFRNEIQLDRSSHSFQSSADVFRPCTSHSDICVHAVCSALPVLPSAQHQQLTRQANSQYTPLFCCDRMRLIQCT